MLRIDVEESDPLSERSQNELLEGLDRALRTGVGAVVLSDYDKGTLTDAVVKQAIQRARAHAVPVVVDPKHTDRHRYQGATVLSPNEKELAAMTGVSPGNTDELFKAARDLCRQIDVDFAVITLGANGIALIDSENAVTIGARAKEVFDVSGAGDTVTAIIAAGLACGMERPDIVALANLAAGIVVGKVGTVPVARHELLAAVEADQELGLIGKICDAEELVRRVERWRASGESIVLTNGCFDLLHVGHVVYLGHAKAAGDRLVVALNTDESVRRLKGPDRPFVGQGDRARIMAALAAVDVVVLFDEETPIGLIETLRPDVLVKGDDYAEDEVVGAKEVKSWDGRVVLVPVVEGRSTTDVVDAIRKTAGIDETR